MPKATPNRKSAIANRKSTGTAPGRGRSPAELVRKSNAWRDNYNPLRSLVISKVISVLEAAERGDYVELELILRKIEKRYPVLKALKARRLSALEELDWEIKTIDPKKLPKGATEAQAQAQQEYLRSRYELIENLAEAFGSLALAEIRGFAILQKHRFTEGENDGAVRELHWLPQWCFSRDGQFGDFYWNPDSAFGIGVTSAPVTLGETNRIGGAELPREDFVMREVDTPLYEIVLIAFTNWAMGRKDWAAFVEIYGLIQPIIELPPNVPEEREDEFVAGAQAVADGNNGVIPNGAKVNYPGEGVRGNSPFKEFCDANDADVVLAGTGGLLTMLSMPTGIGSGPSEQHEDAFEAIAQADARKLNGIFQKDFDKIELNAEFPGQPILAYFELRSVEEEDATAVVDRVQKLELSNYETDPKQITELTGLNVTRKAPVAPPTIPGFPSGQPGPLKNRDVSAPAPDQESQFRTEVAADLNYILAGAADEAAAIAAITDPQLRQQRLAALNARLDARLADVLLAPASAQPLATIIKAGLKEGLTAQ